MNKKIENKTEYEIILNSLGLLDKDEEKSLMLKVIDSSDVEKKLMKELNNLTSLLANTLTLSENDFSPSRKVKESLLEKIKSKNEITSDKNKQGFDFVFSGSDEWMQHPEIAGIKVKRLAVNESKGYLMILLKAAADTVYPPHHHSGAEECYVLEGDLFVEGKYLGPGDFHHAEGGSDHDPLVTKNGCTLLLVVDPKDY